MQDKVHVYPVSDVMPHKKAADCWCMPEWNGEIFLHHKIDFRQNLTCQEIESLKVGLADYAAGRVRPFDEIRKSLNIRPRGH